MDWKSGAIKVELLDPSGQVVEVDLSTRITSPTKNGKGNVVYNFNHLMRQCYTIPESSFENLKDDEKITLKKRVVGLLESACRQAGFSLVAGNPYKTDHGTVVHPSRLYRSVHSSLKYFICLPPTNGSSRP
jgi:hypothetical protein